MGISRERINADIVEQNYLKSIKYSGGVKSLANSGRGSFEKIFRQFKREVEKERLLQEVKDRQFYEKPSKTRRQKKLRKAFSATSSARK